MTAGKSPTGPAASAATVCERQCLSGLKEESDRGCDREKGIIRDCPCVMNEWSPPEERRDANKSRWRGWQHKFLSRTVSDSRESGGAGTEAAVAADLQRELKEAAHTLWDFSAERERQQHPEGFTGKPKLPPGT